MKPILVADDDMTVTMMLKSVIEDWGYTVKTADNGRAALEMIENVAVCVALIDWDMPGISGIDICRRMMDSPGTTPVYRILLTAKGGSNNIAFGLDAGAHDYITKPFEPMNLKARISVGIRFYELEESLMEKNRSLQEYGTQMESLANERAEQLVHADRLSTLGMLTAGIAHEVNNPATFISGNISILSDFMPALDRALTYYADHSGQGDSRIHFIRSELPVLIREMRSGVKRISSIVDGLRIYARKESMQEAPFNAGEMIDEVLLILKGRLKRVSLKTDIEKKLIVYGDRQRLEQVLINMIVNALDELEKKTDPRILLTARDMGGSVVFTVEDNGPGVAETDDSKLFSPFFTTKEPGKGTGLGLSISQGIVQEHKGTIEIDRSHLGGASFVIRLPRKPKERDTNGIQNTPG
ncbi:MAG: sensor histidine kinase [Fibrobacterota bacterium]